MSSDPEHEDLRTRLAADADGSQAHLLVYELSAQSRLLAQQRAAGADRADDGDSGSDLRTALCRAYAAAADIVDTLAPRLRSLR